MASRKPTRGRPRGSLGPYRPGAPGLGLAVRLARRARGLTLEQLGELVGADRRTVAGWETGRHRPAHETAARLAGTLPELRRMLGVDEAAAG